MVCFRHMHGIVFFSVSTTWLQVADQKVEEEEEKEEVELITLLFQYKSGFIPIKMLLILKNLCLNFKSSRHNCAPLECFAVTLQKKP